LLARHALGELFAGLGLGLLPVLGTAFVLTGSYSLAALAAGIPSGILTFNLLLINEFPDVEADKKGGRKNLLLVFGVKQAGKIYGLLMAACYLWIIVAAALKLIPVYCLIALLTVAVALKPIKWTWNEPDDHDTMIPALGANVITNLACHVLLGIGFIASIYL
jgi:1,4-dihydroxy-2-naphthoate octaprenyltransferase